MVFGECRDCPEGFLGSMPPSVQASIPDYVQTCLASQTSVLEKPGQGLCLCYGACVLCVWIRRLCDLETSWLELENLGGKIYALLILLFASVFC